MENGQPDVLGAKVMSPLGNAVRFIDGEQRQSCTFHQRQEARRDQSFRCDVQQIKLAGDEFAFHPHGCLAIQRGVEHSGADAGFLERRHLVLHECDQWRDDHAASVAQQGRDLVAKRLAAAGRHQHQGIATGSHVVDNVRLAIAECRVAEYPAQDGKCRHGRILEA